MASIGKRSWKLQDFQAHHASVLCLALGHKSGHVMVTGGDDKKVNLWALGKPSCVMSLSGHLTPVECVQFNHLEELVCAGSRAGALKVWDLEAAKLVRTLNGHKHKVKCIEFHPYGDILASGSADSTIKTWDSRRKGVLYTYNGHVGTVNSMKFSPDGRWIASGGEDGTVKIWDLRIGRVLHEFTDHLSSVTCVAFHPHEFLLASGSVDQSVHFFDLEHFNLVSSECDLGEVRSMCFHTDGECLFTGFKDCLKTIGWEPSRLYDSELVNWGRVCDISVAQNQLVGASFFLTNVQVYVVDLKKCYPLGPAPADTPLNHSPFNHNSSLRKSFSKAEKPVNLKGRTIDVLTIEESTSGTDPEEESLAQITNLKDYREIFKGKDLPRTPPPEPEPFQEPERDYSDPPVAVIPNNVYIDPAEPQILNDHDHITESVEALSLDNNLNKYQNSEPPAISPNKYSRSKSNLDQVYLSRLSKQQDRENNIANNRTKPTTAKFNFQRQSSVKEGSESNRERRTNNIKHSVSEANINKGSNTSRVPSRKNSFSKPSRNSSVPNFASTKIFNSGKIVEKPKPVKDEETYLPSSIDKPVGVDFDDFLPKNQFTLGLGQQMPEMSEAEGLGAIMRGHSPMMNILAVRKRNLRLLFAQLRNKDLKSALETAIAIDDLSTLVDVLGVINTKYSKWNLDLCVTVLPKIPDLVQSKYEQYMTIGCDTLKLILRHFGPVIRSNVQSPVGSFGVDIPREERYQKSVKCHEMLAQLRSSVTKKLNLPGNLGAAFREVEGMMVLSLD